jgi:hypothetical protein
MSARPRYVIVNTDPRGKWHEVDCKRFVGAAKKGSLSNPDRYRLMRINEVPAGKKHCSDC